MSENVFLNFYFLNVDNAFIMHDPELKLSMCIEKIALEGNMSQNFGIGPSSFLSEI